MPGIQARDVPPGDLTELSQTPGTQILSDRNNVLDLDVVPTSWSSQGFQSILVSHLSESVGFIHCPVSCARCPKMMTRVIKTELLQPFLCHLLQYFHT